MDRSARLGGGTSVSSVNSGVTPLMISCQNANELEVKAILQRKVRTQIHSEAASVRDRTGKTALHYCAENLTTACAELLLHYDPGLLNVQDEDGYTALHFAVISGNRTITMYLIDKGADINCVDNERHTCIHWATVCGELELLNMLVELGADPSTADVNGAHPIHYAAQMCAPNSEMANDVRASLHVLRKLISLGVSVSAEDADGRGPLLWAASGETLPSKTYCASASADAILELINAGADVHSADKDGLTALHCAASRGQAECCETLLALCSAAVDVPDLNGCSPLFYAVSLGHADCAALLLKHGAQPNLQDKKGRTASHCGASKGQLETLKILFHNGANLWIRNAKGDLPLHDAVYSGRRELVHWMLDHQASSVNAANSSGKTALHIAALGDSIEMCKVLMDFRATVNPVMRTNKSVLMTPLDAALSRGNSSVAKYLVLHGALPFSKITDVHDVDSWLQHNFIQSDPDDSGDKDNTSAVHDSTLPPGNVPRESQFGPRTGASGAVHNRPRLGATQSDERGTFVGTTGGGKSVLDASLAGHTDSGYYDTSKDNNNPNVTNVQVLLNSPQFVRKADQLAQQQQQTQQVLVSKSIQDPVGVGGRNIITNVYLGGIGPGIVDYLPVPGNPDDEASIVTSAKINVVQDENENNVLLTSNIGSGVDPVDGSNLQVYPDDETDASRTDSRARKMSTAETVDVAITGLEASEGLSGGGGPPPPRATSSPKGQQQTSGQQPLDELDTVEAVQEPAFARKVMDAELLPGVDYFLIGETVSDTAVSAMPFVELRDSSTSPIAWLNTQIETIATSDVAVGGADDAAVLDTEDTASSPMATLAHESQGVQTIPPPPTEDTPCSPIVISPLERHADMTDGEAMTDLTMDAINDTVSGASTSDRPKPISTSTAVGTPVECVDAHVGSSRPVSRKTIKFDRSTSPIKIAAYSTPPSEHANEREESDPRSRSDRNLQENSRPSDDAAAATGDADAESRTSSSVDLGVELDAGTPVSLGEQPMPDITRGDITSDMVADIERQLIRTETNLGSPHSAMPESNQSSEIQRKYANAMAAVGEQLPQYHRPGTMADDSDLTRPRKVQRKQPHHLEHHLDSLAGAGFRGHTQNVNEDIVKTVGDSIRRYRLEHKLFSELQELKRHQIRSKQTNENVLVKRMVDHFRLEVLAPGMRDYAGSYTFREFERYLYGQLRDVATAADPETAGGSSAPSSTASPLDPSFGHVTTAGSSGPSSFQTVTLPPPPSTSTALSRPVGVASQRTPSPSKQAIGRKANVNNMKPAERRILDDTPVKLPGEREAVSGAKGLSTTGAQKRVLPRIGNREEGQAGIQLGGGGEERLFEEGPMPSRTRRAIGLRPPTKPTLPRHRSPSVGKHGTAESSIEGAEDKDRVQQSMREQERDISNSEHQTGVSSSFKDVSTPKKDVVTKESAVPLSDRGVTFGLADQPVRSQKITLVDKMSGRLQQTSTTTKLSEKGGETETFDTAVKDGKEVSKDKSTRKRRAELPSRKARSLSRKRSPGEGEPQFATATGPNRGSDTPKARSEERDRRPFSYLKKNGGKQSYSSKKIADEHKQPTIQPLRSKTLSAAPGQHVKDSIGATSFPSGMENVAGGKNLPPSGAALKAPKQEVSSSNESDPAGADSNAGKSPPRSSKSPRRRQVITRSSRESPRSSAMFPYMVSGDKNVDPEERSKADQESDSKTCRASADEKHIVDDKTVSVLNGKMVTETAVSGTVKGVSSAKAARDSRQSPTMSKAKIVTSTQTEECKERITEVHVKEVETFSSVKTHEQTREEIVTVEWKPQGLGRSKPSDIERTVNREQGNNEKTSSTEHEPHVQLRRTAAKVESTSCAIGDDVTHPQKVDISKERDQLSRSPGSTATSPGLGPTITSSARRKRAQWNKSGEITIMPMGSDELESLEHQEAVDGAAAGLSGGPAETLDAAKSIGEAAVGERNSDTKSKESCKIRSSESRSSAKIVRGILGDDVNPDDLVTLEMVPSNSESGASQSGAASQRHKSLVRTIKVRDILEAADNEDLVIRQAELRASNVPTPPSSTTPVGSSGSDEEMVEFIVRHGREKNIFWLPASRITQDRKWQVTFVVAKTTGNNNNNSTNTGPSTVEKTPVAVTAKTT
ncbi:microtubule-associated protein futsch-like isoform X4 [Varroa destructor]|uniref:Uncharacterized protein n=1 Tax=Varroa destructor TaxID=109461 RepID=A0A7M7KPL4_VARDE|nr:microtubule-associated protein futsch-like isoform X4 [Varroa destructor]